ncbi:MAG: GNAT family N-acetyltransferase [Ruthenibacterium sp.]
MKIRCAVPQDLPAILEIITLAKEGLAAHGVDQWQDGYPNRAQLAADIESGRSYVGVFAEKICAVTMISFDADPNYAVIENGAWTREAPYCVLHRVAVHPTYRNRHCAAELLAFATQMCAERGISYLRIDTHLDNKPMRGFLEKSNFRQCGMIYLDNLHDETHARVAYDRCL